MTPTEQFAAKRLEAEQLIRQHAPARLQDQLIALLRPAIALTATRVEDEQIPIGASKFGGAPDVPADFEWPMWNGKPLGFLAQINLGEVAPFDVEGLLPKGGLLTFFYFPWDYGYADNDATMKSSWRVFHFAEGQKRGEMPVELASPQTELACSCSVKVEAEWTVAESANRGEMTDEESDQLGVLLYEIFPRPQPRHRLLGWHDPVQGEVEEQCAGFSGDIDLRDPNWNEDEANRKIEQWRLLLQVDSDHENLNCEWGDGGALFFMIRADDLATPRFGDVWFVHEGG